MSDATTQRSPFAAGALDGAVVAFAGVTLIAHALVRLGRSLDDFVIVCAAAAVLTTAGAVWAKRRGLPAAIPLTGVGPAPDDRNANRSRPARVALWAGAAVAVLAGALTGSLVVWWVCALATFGLALLEATRTPVQAAPPRRTAGTDRVLVALGLLLAGAVAFAHRADGDDSFYVNLIVAAVDDPAASLLAGDTLHGYAGIPMALPVFQVLSWEITQAAFARVLALDALTFAHLVVPPLVALLVPLAWARLAMRLLPATWPWAVAIVVLGLLFVGDGRAGHGDFGVLRLHQGKSVMLHVALPLCTAYAIEFGLSPSRWGFVRLAAVQVAAVGLSASGLWLGPVAAGLGLMATMPFRPSALAARARDLAIGLAASAYPIALALSLRTATALAMADAPRPLDGAALSGPELMEQAADLVLGEGPYRWLALFALVAATATTGAPLMRRFAAVAGAFFVVLLFGPWTAEPVARGVTGADTYFRVFWAIPLPLWVAGLLTEPLRASLPDRLAGASTRALIAVVAAALALVAIPDVFTLSPRNGTRVAIPGPKLPPVELETARLVAAHAEPRHRVLAPLTIARWLPLLHDHPQPLMVRELYLDRLHALLGVEELDRRRALAHLVGGSIRSPEAAALLADAIDRYPLQVVCLTGAALGWPEVRRVLRESPLEVVDRSADHEVWARSLVAAD